MSNRPLKLIRAIAPTHHPISLVSLITKRELGNESPEAPASLPVAAAAKLELGSERLESERLPFIVAANVGIFSSDREEGIALDAFLSLGVSIPTDWSQKQNRSYLVWRFGKFPAVAIEIVGDRKGNELVRKDPEKPDKKAAYARMGIAYNGSLRVDPPQFPLTKATVYTQVSFSSAVVFPYPLAPSPSDGRGGTESEIPSCSPSPALGEGVGG